MTGEVTPTKEQIAQMRKEELRLKRRFGVRVRVDKLAGDKAHVLCSAWRTGPALLQSRLDEYEMVDLVHEALRSLHALGLRPLVGVVLKRNMTEVPPIAKTDPFQLLAAINNAQKTGPPEMIKQEEIDRRATLLSVQQVVK